MCRVVLNSVTVALVLLCVSLANVSDMAGCRKRLCDNFVSSRCVAEETVS